MSMMVAESPGLKINILSLINLDCLIFINSEFLSICAHFIILWPLHYYGNFTECYFHTLSIIPVVQFYAKNIALTSVLFISFNVLIYEWKGE